MEFVKQVDIMPKKEYIFDNPLNFIQVAFFTFSYQFFFLYFIYFLYVIMDMTKIQLAGFTITLA